MPAFNDRRFRRVVNFGAACYTGAALATGYRGDLDQAAFYALAAGMLLALKDILLSFRSLHRD